MMCKCMQIYAHYFTSLLLCTNNVSDAEAVLVQSVASYYFGKPTLRTAVNETDASGCTRFSQDVTNLVNFTI